MVKCETFIWPTSTDLTVFQLELENLSDAETNNTFVFARFLLISACGRLRTRFFL